MCDQCHIGPLLRFGLQYWGTCLKRSNSLYLNLSQPNNYLKFNMEHPVIVISIFFLQGNQFVCDQCHIGPLLKWLRSSLQYWGTCLKRSNSLCLKCSQPNEYLHMPLEDLNMTSLPECQVKKYFVRKKLQKFISKIRKKKIRKNPKFFWKIK